MKLNLSALTLLLASFFVLAPTIIADEALPEDGVGKRVRRIVGGELVALRKYPFATHISWYLVRKYKKTLRIICTGVVISEFFVLTAASCFEQLVRENYNSKDKSLNRVIQLTKYQKTFVRAGTVDGTRYKTYEHQERVGVTLYVHPEYLHVSTMFDVNIALIRVKDPFEFSLYFVRPASFAKRMSPKGEHVNNYCLGIGFGFQTQREANISATPDPAEIDLPETYYGTMLRQFKVKAGGDWFCRKLEKELSGRNEPFDDFYLCAISKNIRGYEHNCEGDLGGPLVCGGLVLGILSQRREKRACDISSPSFSMYAGIGESIVYDWIKTLVPNITTVYDVPFEDPYNATQWYPDEPEDWR